MNDSGAAHHATGTSAVRHCRPLKGDGSVLWQLAQETKGLEANSEYCYHLLQLHHANSCVIAYLDEQPAGFVAGYIPQAFDYAEHLCIPDDAPGRTLFVWQVGVLPTARGKGLAREMIQEILARDANPGIRYIQSTVSPGNKASESLFRSLAENYQCEYQFLPFLAADDFQGDHEPENLFHIGPIVRT